MAMFAKIFCLSNIIRLNLCFSFKKFFINGLMEKKFLGSAVKEKTKKKRMKKL